VNGTSIRKVLFRSCWILGVGIKSTSMSSHSYREILSALVEAKVDFIIGGGVACVLQGVERVTMDVDLAILMSPKNLDLFIKVMEALKLKPRVPIPPTALLDPLVVRQIIEEKHALVFTFLDFDRPTRQVDIFLRPELAYDKLFPDTEQLRLDDLSVRVLTKSKLLEIKLGIQPPRTKDILDIAYLRQHVR
jgi:hypothetical protein